MKGTIRGALVVGFTVVFAVWAFAGYELIRSVHEVERQVAAANDAFRNNSDVLSMIRRNVLMGSVYVRDVLIDPGSVARESYRDELRTLRSEIDATLPAAAPAAAQPAQRERWQRLEAQLDRYWDSLDFAFEPLQLNTTAAA